MPKFSSVVILADSYWDSLTYHAQNMATEFLRHNYPVYFIERLPQRMPRMRFSDLKQWLFKKGYGNDTIINPRPSNLTVLGFRSLPPARWLRTLNRAILRKAFAPHLQKLRNSTVLLISYAPTYTQIDIASIIKPSETVYVSVHNYDASTVLPDLLKAELEIINSRAILAADSDFNAKRLKRLDTHNKVVYRLAPGVDYNLFKTASTGKPTHYKKLYYFGGIGNHLNLEIYNTLAQTLDVTFIGVIDENVKPYISQKIKLLLPVPVRELPSLIAPADMLGIFYKKSPYIDGVIPAKFFECLATTKPLLVSGMEETKQY
ncbi:MAG: hypothetical protein WCS77_01335, partial [Elusimicrobiaceae bacterium]